MQSEPMILNDATAYCTALYLAAQNGHQDVVKYISELDIMPDTAEMEKCTALFFAAQHGYLNIIKMCLQNRKGDEVIGHENKKQLEEAQSTSQITSNYKHDLTIETLLKNGVYSKDDLDNTALHYAAMDGNINMVKSLIQHGTDLIYSKNMDFDSVLHCAARNGHVNIIELLLNEGIFIDSSNKFRNTPLHIAVFQNQEDVVQYLLDHDACTDIQNVDGNTPLHIAAMLGHDKIVLKLIKSKQINLMCRNKNDFLPMHLAAENDHSIVIEYFLERCLDINLGTTMGNQNCLSLAVKGGHIDLVKFLIKRGANVEIKDRHINSILLLAISIGNMKMVETIFNLGVCATTDKLVLIQCAIMYGHVHVVEFFLDNGFSINLAQNGRTALDYAAQYGHEESVQLLLARGAKTDVKDCDYPPIYYASIQGHVRIVEILIGDQINQQIKNKSTGDVKTCLSLAAENGHINLVNMLIAKGASLKYATQEITKTPLHYAGIKGHINIVKLFLNNGVNVNVKDNYSRTTLSYAAEYGHEEIVKLLISKGASKNLHANLKRPLDYATERKYFKIAKLLKK